jgi:hypothetical protein
MKRALLAAVAGLAIAAPSAQAAQLTVTTTADQPRVCVDGACPTLRAALETSAGTPETDSIQLPAGDYQLLSDLPVPAGVTIAGASARCSCCAASASGSRPGEVGPGGAKEDRLLLHLVEDRDDALGHLGQGAGAGVLDEPPGAADGGGAVLAAGAEGA